MNKTYRLVWCSFRNAWIAVSELSKSKAKSSKTRTIGSVIAAGLMLTFSAEAFAYVASNDICQPNPAPNQQNTTNSFYGQNIVCDWNTTYSTLVGNKITAGGNTVNLVAVGNNISTGAGSERSTVLGSKITHSGRFTTVIGQNIKSNTEHSIVMGEDTTIDGGNYDISIGGNQNISNSQHTVALGNNIKTSGSITSLAAGNDTTITNSRLATAVGDRTSVTDSTSASAFGAGSSIKKADHSTAVGIGASVNESHSSFAGGKYASITGGYGNIAIGSTSTVSNTFGSSAIGYESSVTGNSRGMALGTQAKVTDSDRGTALGASASVTNSASASASGNNASVTDGIGSQALGNNANVTSSTRSSAMGNGAKITSSNDALAAGSKADVATSERGTAVGFAATVDNSSNANAIGTGAKVVDSYSASAFGTNATVTNSKEATAIGRYSKVTDSAQSIVAGYMAQANLSAYSTALGYNANVKNATSSVALGTNAAVIDSNQASAFGVNSSITSSSSGVAIGNNAKLNSAADGIAIGSSANVTSVANGIAIGKNAAVTTANSVALGAGSTAVAAAVPTNTATVGPYTYSGFAGTAPVGVVSVGSAGKERQITNVAAGRISNTSTDAINGSQLYATQQTIGNLANSTASIIGTPVTVNPDGTLTSGNIGGTTKNNVSDAINEVRETPLNFAGNTGDTVSKKLGETLSIVGGSAPTAAATAANTRVDSEDGNLVVKMAKDLTDLTSVTTTDASGNTSVLNGAGLTSTDFAGNKTVVNGAGVATKDAAGNSTVMNGNGLVSTDFTGNKTVINGSGLTVVNKDGSTGPSITNTGIDAGGLKVTNVADGEISATSKDAVNGSQLHQTTVDLTNQGLNFADSNGNVTHKNLGDTLGIIGGGTKADSDYSASNVKTTTDENGNIVVMLDKNLNADSLTINGKDGVDGAPGTPGFTLAGATGPAGVNGLPGETTTRIVYDDGTGPQEVATLNDGLKFAGNQGDVIAKKLNETLTVKGGLDNDADASDANLRVDSEDGNLVVKMAKDLTDLNSVTLGNTVLNQDGLTVGGANGPSITTAGINAGGLTITNVAPGVNGTDAVNVDQLNSKSDELTNLGLNFVDNNGTVTHKNLGETLGIVGGGTKADSEYSSSNIKTTTDADGNVVVMMDKNLNADSLVLNGKDGVDGQPGTPGLTITGATGPAGVNGAPGETTTRIVYDDGTGPQQVATLNDGLKFAGNQGDVIAKKLNETLTVKGGLDNDADASDANLRVDSEDGNLVVKMAKDLTDINSVTLGNTVLNQDGLTVGGANGPSITTAGINAGGTTITNVAAGQAPTDAVNVSQLKDAAAAATTEVKAADGDKNVSVTSTTADDGHTIYSVGVSRDLNVDSVTLPNADGSSTNLTAGGLSFKDADGNATGPSVTANGIDAGGLKVTNVADGTIGEGSKDAVNGGQLYQTTVDLTNLGLNFVDNNGTVTHKNLGETLGIVGGGTKADSEYSSSNIKTTTDADGNVVVMMDKNLNADSLVLNGKDGVDGQPGTPGLTITGATGPAGVNGAPGETTTRIVYDDGTGPQQVATLNDGLKFAGNQGDVIAKKLNETLTVKGGLDNDADASDANLRVDSEDGNLVVKMAKDLTDINSVTLGNTVLNQDGLTVGGANGPSITTAGINAGGTTITNVAAGQAPTDAVNVSQLKDAAAAATTEVKAADGDKNVSVTSTTADDGHTVYSVGVSRDLDVDSVTLAHADGSSTLLNADGLSFKDAMGTATGPSITAGGIDAGNLKVTNVADGEISATSKDAVNGSQLYNLGNNVTNIFGGNATYNGDQIVWNNIGGTGQNTIDDAIKYVNDQASNANQGWNVATDSGTASTVKPGDTVNINGDKNSGVTVTNDGNNITVGLSDKVNVGDKVSIDGNTGTINAGKVTIDGENGTIGGLTNTTWDPNNITSGQAATEDQLAQVAQKAGEQAAAAKTEVTQGNNIVVTESKADDGHTVYNVATADDVKFNSVDAGTVNAGSVNVGNVTIDQNGINAGNNKVTNVSDGTIAAGSKDAVNGGQLYQTNQNIANYLGGGSTVDANGNTTAPTYNVAGGSYNNVGDALGAVDNRVTNVQNNLDQAFRYTNNRISNLEDDLSAGIAATAALENAPYVPGKWTYAAGAAYYNDQSAIGVTLRRTADNGRWSLNGGVAGGTSGSPLFRIGVSGVID